MTPAKGGDEEEKLRKWARDNWSPVELPENFSALDPVIRDEWRKLDEQNGWRFNPVD